jgi:uncharacterized protein (TIGR02118 family)
VSVSYFVRYEGPAENRAEFLRYYRERHVPILARFSGIQRIVLHTSVEWQDRFAVRSDRFMLLAQMIFANAQDLERALGSSARAEAREDFGRFPRFEGAVYHQAANTEEIWAAEECQ